MDATTVVFNGLSSLDFEDVRANVVRIPEVSLRLKEAQEIWNHSGDEFSFFNFLSSENETFLSSIKFKRLAAAIVQVGLYDRHVKRNGYPQFIVGCHNGISAMKVSLGQIEFRELIVSSPAYIEASEVVHPIRLESPDQLCGVQMSEFSAYKRNEKGGYESLELDSADLNAVIGAVADEYSIKQLINIGPGNTLVNSAYEQVALRDIQVSESIDIDPMLSWFWSSLHRHNPIAVAQ